MKDLLRLSFSVGALVALSSVFVCACSASSRVTEPTPTETETPSPTPDDRPGVLEDGRVTAVLGEIQSGRIIMMSESPADARNPIPVFVEVTADTTIIRATRTDSSASLLIGNDVPIREGDYITVGGHLQPYGYRQAEEVTANYYAGRQGIVTEVGPNYFDIRPRKCKGSDEFLGESIRVWVLPASEVAETRVHCGPTRRFDSLQAGDRIFFEGLLTDDGSVVAVCFY